MTSSHESPATGLRIGFVPGVTLTKWRRIWGERFRAPLEVVEVAVDAQREALVGGRVDMCFARLPLDTDGLHAIPLYEEQPVLWLSKDHPLADLDQITDADLADENVLHDADQAGIELATYSAAVLRVPMSVARTGSRRDLVYRPVVDADPTTIALAWRVDNSNEWIDEFIGVVRGRTPNSSRSARERDAAQPAPSTKTTRAKQVKPAGRAGSRRGRGTQGRRGR